MTKRKGVTLFSICLLILILLGCAAPAAEKEVAREVRPIVETVGISPQAAPAAPDLATASKYGEAEVSGSLEEQMIIRTGNLSVVVSDTEAALEQIKSIAAELKGYIVSSNAWRVEQQLRARLTLRVPAGSFDAAMERIKGIANSVEREDTSSQDVTEEYTDLGSRLRNLEATEKELLALLTQVRERTGKAEDILAIHRELTNIRGQIEQVKGRMQYLERMTAMATINVDLVPDALAKPIVVAGWRPNATVSNALRNLVKAFQFIIDALIWILFFGAPLVIVASLPLVVLLLFIRRWRRRRKATS